MIIPTISASVLIRLTVLNLMTSIKFGDQTQLKGMKIKGMTRVNTADDDVDNFDNQQRYVTLKQGATLHFDKFPISEMKTKERADTFSLKSEKPIDWANSLIEWNTPLAGLPTEGKYITFLVFYEKA